MIVLPDGLTGCYGGEGVQFAPGNTWGHSGISAWHPGVTHGSVLGTWFAAGNTWGSLGMSAWPPRVTQESVLGPPEVTHRIVFGTLFFSLYPVIYSDNLSWRCYVDDLQLVIRYVIFFFLQSMPRHTEASLVTQLPNSLLSHSTWALYII